MVMARQRWGPRHRHGSGGWAGLAGLALAGVIAGCGGEPRSPIGIFEPPDRPPGRSSTASAVVGTWRVTLIIVVQSDLQEWTTTWRFGSDGRCDFQRETLSAAEGVRRTVARACTYVDRSSQVDVTYDDGERTALPYEIPAFSNQRLILEGVEYERIG
jgi:hypothetical protein